MPHKHKMIINRHTWNLQQFEFSVPWSYQDSMRRLRMLQTELLAQPVDNRGFRPSLKLESDDDTSSFEWVLNNVTVMGTVQQITDETTLIFGLSTINGAFYGIVVFSVVIGLVIFILPFLSAYTMSKPVWSPDTIFSISRSMMLVLVFLLLFYGIYRWHMWRAVNKLVATVDY